MEGGPRGLGVRGTAGGPHGTWGSEQGLGASTLSGPGSPEPVPEDEPVLKTPAGAPLPRPGPGLAEGPRVWSPHWGPWLRVLASGPRTGPGSSVPVSRPGPATLRRPLAFRLVGGRLRGRGRAPSALSPPPRHSHPGTGTCVPFPLCVTCGWSCARISWGALSPAGSCVGLLPRELGTQPHLEIASSQV